MPTADGQPDILSLSKDAFGRTVVVDTEGTTVLDPSPGTQAGGTFGVGVNWSGGTAEIRWSSEDDQNNNRSLVHVSLYAHTSGFTTYGTSQFLMRANGDGWSGWNVSIGGGWTHIAQRDVWTGHGANGALGMEVGVVQGEVLNTSFNNASGTQWVSMTDYVVLPYAPYNVAVDGASITTTSFGVQYFISSHDHVDVNHAQWATDPYFNNVVWLDTQSYGYTSPGGVSVQLTPGTTHYVRIQSHTARGWGPWSATVSATTLPAVPPGFTIVATPSGQGATLTFTPPGGVTGVTPYLWERRVKGTTSPVASGSTPTTVAEVTGLTPGEVYEWRASAMIGSYQSPWTDDGPLDWTTLQQPKPNTNPGDYFDGNTTDTPDLDYGWTGAPNNSASQAIGKAVTGWQATFGSGATGAIHQVLGGLVSANAARVLIQIDATAAGAAEGGQSAAVDSRSQVADNASYIGSIYVKPSRDQRMRALLQWLDAAGGVVGTTHGVDQLLPGGSWTRLSVTGVVPPGADFVVVRVHDVAGTGHTPWKGGDSFLLDAAMISLGQLFPYFDGDTADTDTTVYAWTGTRNASPSTATPAGVAAAVGTLGALPGALDLIDPDCATVPSPPRPPSVPSDCIEDVGVWRRYYVAIPAINISDWLSVVLTLEIETGAVAARQVRVRVYPNPFNYAPEQVDTDEWCAEQIISYMPASTVLTLDGMTMRAWAEVNQGAPQSADHLLYGTGGQPPTWPILSCGISYLVSLEVPIDAPEGNIDSRAFVTTRS